MIDGRRLAVIAGVLTFGLIGWAVGGGIGAAVGLLMGTALLMVPWWGCPAWSWMARYLRRGRRVTLAEPLTIINDRAGGGVRYQGGVAAVAVQLIGKPYAPTFFTGSAATETDNRIDVRTLIPTLHQSLGLKIDSISIVNAGARRRATGDYPRVYDTLIGTPPYAGRRETWLIMRISAFDNAEALQWRRSVGAAALAAAQRLAATLRRMGFRARVATAADLFEFESRLGRTALEPRNRGWNSARSERGWQTTYTYRPADINTDSLAQAWAIPADEVIQNVTLLADETVTATVTFRTAQAPTTPPSVALVTLPGEQTPAMMANLCGPRPKVGGVRRARLNRSLYIPIGPSGVLLGRTPVGDRLAIPLGDQGEQSRVHIAADDAIAKRIIIRAAAAGDRVTVHSTDLDRWESVRMPDIAVIEHPRPTPGSTISVTDGTVIPVPRPNTVITVGPPGGSVHPTADIVVTQTGPATVEISAAGVRREVDVEFFRAEHRYASRTCPSFIERTGRDRLLEMAE